MTRSDDIRKSVSQAYAAAVAEGGCCSASSRKSALASYPAEEVAAIPEDAVGKSFGCGNPVAFTEMKEGDVVLDLGSGAGVDLILAARKVGPAGRVIGVDMTDAMIERARANVTKAGLSNVELRKGIVEDLPVADASIDWVISNCVLNLSPEKPRAFAEIARVLRRGGQMLVSDIVVEDLPDWVRQSAAFYCACVAGAISEREYLASLEAAGLHDVKVVDSVAYDSRQVAAMAEGELSDLVRASSCCGGGPTKETVARLLAPLSGKIRSIRVSARRP